MTRPMPLDTRDEWQTAALLAIRDAAQGYDFTADDLRAVLPEPDHTSMWGLVFKQAAEQGLIRYIKHTRSTTPSRNHGSISVWERTKDTP